MLRRCNAGLLRLEDGFTFLGAGGLIGISSSLSSLDSKSPSCCTAATAVAIALISRLESWSLLLPLFPPPFATLGRSAILLPWLVTTLFPLQFQAFLLGTCELVILTLLVVAVLHTKVRIVVVGTLVDGRNLKVRCASLVFHLL